MPSGHGRPLIANLSQVETRGRKKKTSNFGKPSKDSETNGMQSRVPSTVDLVCGCSPCLLRYGWLNPESFFFFFTSRALS